MTAPSVRQLAATVAVRPLVVCRLAPIVLLAQQGRVHDFALRDRASLLTACAIGVLVALAL